MTRKPRSSRPVIQKPPTRNELGRGEFPDVLHLIKHFLGKSRDQVYAMLAGKGGSYWTEDYTYMEATGFEYYLEPVVRYLRSEESNGDSDFATGILVSLASQIRENRLPSHVQSQVRDLAAYVRANLGKFEIELDDYQEKVFAQIEGTEFTDFGA